MVLPQHGGGAKDDQKFVAKKPIGHHCFCKEAYLWIALQSVCRSDHSSIRGTACCKRFEKNKTMRRNGQMFNSFMNKVGANWSDNSIKFVNAAMKIQKAIRKKQVGRTQTLDAHALNIESNFFVKQDGSTCDILKTLQGAKSGVCLLSCEESQCMD